MQTLDSDNKVAVITFDKKIVCANKKWQQYIVDVNALKKGLSEEP